MNSTAALPKASVGSARLKPRAMSRKPDRLARAAAVVIQLWPCSSSSRGSPKASDNDSIPSTRRRARRPIRIRPCGSRGRDARSVRDPPLHWRNRILRVTWTFVREQAGRMRSARRSDGRRIGAVSVGVGLCAVVAAAMAQVPVPDAAACERLASLRLKGGEVTLVQPVGPGALALPGPAREDVKSLAAMCRVAATLKPTPDSDIRIEVWMPASKWNGKFLGVGNGGWNGAIAYAAMITRSAMVMPRRRPIPARRARARASRSAIRRN